MPDLTPQSECASDLRMDEALCGELPTQARNQLERHLSECARCRGRWDDIVKERAAFLSSAPSFEALAAKIERAAKPRATLWTKRWLAGLATAAAATAAVAFMLARPPAQPGVTAGPESGAETDSARAITTRSKGGPRIGFFIKRGASVSVGQSGATVHPGDRLRFTYSSDAPRYLALFNLDSERASVYYPAGPQAARVATGRGIALDFSIELDNHIGSEQVFAVFCERSFQLEPLRRALAASKRMTPGPGCTVDTIRLSKEAAP